MGPTSGVTAASVPGLASMSSELCAVRERGRTRPVSAAQVRAYATKAEEFAGAAASDLDVEALANPRHSRPRTRPRCGSRPTESAAAGLRG